MPHYVEAYDSLSDVLESQGNMAEAKLYFSEAVRIKRDGVAALNGLAMRPNKAGRLEESAQHFRATLQFDPAITTVPTGLETALGQQTK